MKHYFIILVTMFICSSSLTQTTTAISYSPSRIKAAFFRAFQKVYGSPNHIARKSAAMTSGAIIGTLSGAATAILLTRALCDVPPAIMFSDAVPRSQQTIAYCLMTFCESIGFLAGAWGGYMTDEFIYTFLNELKQ